MRSFRVLSRDTLKLIAIVAMTLDHVAWYFLPFTSATAQVFHVVGRVTAPIMCFFIAEGYRHTRSFKNYALRLGVFAVIAQIPWAILHRNASKPSFNMLFTLLLGLLAVHAMATVRHPLPAVLAVAACVAASWYCDWHVCGVLWCVVFDQLRAHKGRALLAFTGISAAYFIWLLQPYLQAGLPLPSAFKYTAFTLGLLLAIPLLLLYSGEKGRLSHGKWFFYLYYPAHLAVIALLR